MATTISLPDYDTWMRSDAWQAHLLDNHGKHWSEVGFDATCPACITKPLLAEIHKAVFSDTLRRDQSTLAANLAWDLCDGYGPDKTGISWDWSGIRDSSPAATQAMYDALEAAGLVG